MNHTRLIYKQKMYSTIKIISEYFIEFKSIKIFINLNLLSLLRFQIENYYQHNQQN